MIALRFLCPPSDRPKVSAHSIEMAESARKDGGWRRLTSGAPLGVFAAAGLLVIYQLLPIIELVAIAMVIALVLRTILRWLEGLGIVPWLAAVMLLGVVGGGSLRLAPSEKRERVRGLIGTIEIRLRGWVVRTGLAMLIVGGGAGVGLWTLGVPLPLTFGVLAGMLELIPYFGPIVGALLPTLVDELTREEKDPCREDVEAAPRPLTPGPRRSEGTERPT
jgi:predicted PurR-regulated permease PerM